MNIMGVLKSKITSLVNDNEQAVSEKLIELATFFYKIDKRVSLEETEYMEGLLKEIDWASSISIESYQRNCIAKINTVIDKSEDRIGQYLSELLEEISTLNASDKAKAIAKEISDADGEIADIEVKYLDIVLSYA